MMHQQLRQLALSRQGLSPASNIVAGQTGTLQMIRQLGYVQIDTIAVIERAHHHVLWNRVPDYQPQHLNALVKAQQIFEYWAHAAAYLPMQDYCFALIQMNTVRRGESRYFNRGDAGIMAEILAQVRAEGPLKSRALEQRHRSGAGEWWHSSAGRRALEQLFMQGDLMICERQGMEKVYDLRERCLPTDLNLSEPNLAEYAHYLFEQTFSTHGIFNLKQLLHLKTGKALQQAMRDIVQEQLHCGRIESVQLHGQQYYVDAQALQQMDVTKPQLKILSPFDNVLIHRDRLQQLFQMDYKLECYVPADKRRYGYFCLPVLYGDQLVARIDCKAHRAEQRLQLISLHMEQIVLDDQQYFDQLLVQELQRFCIFNQCKTLDLRAVPSLNLLHAD